MPTIREMMAFHGIERRFYNRIISLGTPPQISRNLIAISIFLQYIGVDVMIFLSDCHNDSVIQRFVNEARLILDCINHDVPSCETCVALTLTNSRAREDLNLRFFRFNRDVVARTIGYVTAGIGTIIFDVDSNADLNQQYYRRFEPNPMDLRSLFFTCGSSTLGESDIVEFFNGRWDNCVQDMIMEETRGGILPIYGRIVLKDEYYVDEIFRSHRILNMNINGSVITVRKFSAV